MKEFGQDESYVQVSQSILKPTRRSKSAVNLRLYRQNNPDKNNWRQAC